MTSRGAITMCVVPSRQAVLSLSTNYPAPLNRTPSLASAGGDVAVQLLQPLALVGGAAHGGMQAETLLVGTQRRGEGGVSRHRAFHREHLLPDTRAEGKAVSTCGHLQRPERAGVVRIGVAVGQVGRPSSSTRLPRWVSSFISRSTILCSSD